jgi:uncharacterized membrane protein
MAPGCDDHIVGEGIPITSSCLRRPPLNYVNTGEGLVERHCRSCHGRFQIGPQRSQAPVGVDFDDEADVLYFAQEIYQAAVVDQTMPPAGGMLESERQLLDEWLRCDVLPRAGRLELD